MKTTELELARASKRAATRVQKDPRAISAYYEPAKGLVFIGLSNGVLIGFEPKRIQGLGESKPRDLSLIEITPSGYGIHFPKLDADIYVPALLAGLFGSQRWIASHLGRSGGRATSAAKVAAARHNGRLGGRPKRSEQRT